LTEKQIGGSLAKVVYFTRSASSPQAKAESPSTPGFFDKVDGALTPLALDTSPVTDMTSVNNLLQRRAAVNHFPGGSLNFERFETESIDDCTDFICQLIDRSARINRVNIAEMRRSVKIMATGGGAYRLVIKVSLAQVDSLFFAQDIATYSEPERV
jgi:type II pantothenate kinase